MAALVLLLTLPFVILNFLGGIVSGVWLAILGEWWAIGYGVLSLFVSTFILSLVLLPGVAIATPAMMLLEKGRVVLAFPFILLSQIYTYVVISAWCLFVLYFFMSRSNSETYWPLLIWSYGVALGPWMYMAQKEAKGGTGDASAMTTIFAQLSYVAVALVLVFRGGTIVNLAMVFGGIMFFGLVVQTIVAFLASRAQSRYGLM